jgi:hypothetical protein
MTAIHPEIDFPRILSSFPSHEGPDISLGILPLLPKHSRVS